MTDEELLIVFVVAVAVLLIFAIGSKTGKMVTVDEHLIQDDDVDVTKVLKRVNELTPQIVTNPRRKMGFTEREIETQLLKHLQETFQSVVRQAPLTDKDVKTRVIDLDVGRGRVGIELKIAHEVVKGDNTGELFRQLDEYRKRRYDKANVIVAIAGFEEHRRDIRMRDIEKETIKRGHKFTYLNAGSIEQLKND